jgi:hypothetical protein
MRIGLLTSNAALSEYFVSALGFASHKVTLYSSKEGLFFALITAAPLCQRVLHDLLMIELTLDGDWKQAIAELCRLAGDRELPLIILTTSDQKAINLAQAALPGLCIRQLPLPLDTLLSLIQAQGTSTSSAVLLSDR